MAAFKKTNVKIYTKTGPNITPDTLYWKKLGVCKFLNCDLIDLYSSWYYSDYSTPIGTKQNTLVGFVPTWVNTRRKVTVNLQIRVHTVISVLLFLRRHAVSDIWLFPFTFFYYPETVGVCYWLCYAKESKYEMQLRLHLCRCG